MLIGAAIVRADANSTPSDPKSVDQLVNWLSSANNVPPPEFGKARFIYEHWKHPRYVQSDRYEEQLKLQFRAQEAEQEGLKPQQIAEIREAIPVNMALDYMNDTYQKFEIGYAFEGDKLQLERVLLDYQSRLDVPPEVRGNSRVRAFDPALNGRQIVAWDKRTLRRYSLVDQDKNAYLSVVGTVGDPTMERPRLKPNAPPLATLRDKIQQIIPGTTPDGREAYVVHFAFAPGEEERKVRSYYDRHSGVFLLAESEGTQGDERLIFREQYTVEEIDGRRVPRCVEFISLAELKGDHKPRVYERRKFTLQEVDFHRPAPETFSPPIPSQSNEVLVYNGNMLLFDVSRMRVGEALDGLITSLNRVNLSNASEVRDAFSEWNKGGGTLGTADAGNGWLFWSLQVTILAVILIMAVWTPLKRRLRPPVG